MESIVEFELEEEAKSASSPPGLESLVGQTQKFSMSFLM